MTGSAMVDPSSIDVLLRATQCLAEPLASAAPSSRAQARRSTRVRIDGLADFS
jgi:hypothetical protein